jgi:hypothetical protein
MPKVFCCYRREDSTHQTGRIFDQLTARFGKDDLFRDVDSMPLGFDFRNVLSEQVARCDVLLAIIGDAWLSAAEKTGERRLDNPGDFVRIEIESALRRKIPVIPVLVGHAPMPKTDDLPESLRELAFRNGLAVRADPDFHHDIERLIHGINGVLRAGKPKDSQSKPLADLENTRSFLLKNVLKTAANAELEADPKRATVPVNNPSSVAAPVGPAPPQTAPPPPATNGRRLPKRRHLLWGAGILAILGIVTALAVARIGSRKGAVVAAGSEVHLGEVQRQVKDLQSKNPELLHRQEFEDPSVELLPAVKYSSFEILTDERIVDLRKWEAVPPERAGEQVCGVSMQRLVRLRKRQPADEIRLEFRTTGKDLILECTTHPFHVTPQRKQGLYAGKPCKIWQMALDVHAEKENKDFPVDIRATYWNAFQKDEDLWFGATGNPNSHKVSLLVVFPDHKPFNTYRLMISPTNTETPEDFQGDTVLLPSKDRDWLYWEVGVPLPAHLYTLHWTW